MSEGQPFKDGEGVEPTKVPLKGPNVTSTLDTPPRPHAVKVTRAAIRRHLTRRRKQHPPDAPAPDEGA
jgi:hypothetical protein